MAFGHCCALNTRVCLLLCAGLLQATGEIEMSPTRPCPQSHIFRDMEINICIAVTNGHTCGEQSGRASEKKGHGGGSGLFLPPTGLEQQVESKMPTRILQCRGHITGAAQPVARKASGLR